MALIKCPDCGANVSSLAPACIKCGRPMSHSETPKGDDWKPSFPYQPDPSTPPLTTRALGAVVLLLVAGLVTLGSASYIRREKPDAQDVKTEDASPPNFGAAPTLPAATAPASPPPARINDSKPPVEATAAPHPVGFEVPGHFSENEKVPLSECRQSLTCWYDRNVAAAEVDCQHAFEQQEPYEIKWNTSLFRPVFSTGKWASDGKNVIYLGDAAEEQNANGAWQVMIYACTYNGEDQRVISLEMQPRG